MKTENQKRAWAKKKLHTIADKFVIQNAYGNRKKIKTLVKEMEDIIIVLKKRDVDTKTIEFN